jgi:hypothetical protein
MDTSKQAFGTIILHLLNLYLSNNAKSREQCVWYFLNFSFDTILGMALCYLLLHGFERCLQKSETFAFKTGNYGENVDFGIWAYQVWIWIGIILVINVIKWVAMNVFRKPLQFIGEVVLEPISKNPQLELVMVMIIVPLILNSLVFWITDSFLKSDKDCEGDKTFELLPENRTKLVSINIE